jgi:cyclopropane-fatty-acyl-phospholipid synthase
MLESLVLERVQGRLDQLADAGPTLALELPGGRRLGRSDARVTLVLHSLAPLAWLAAGQVGRLAEAYVEGRAELRGTMRDVAEVAFALVHDDPTAPPPLAGWAEALRYGRSLVQHRQDTDARQVQQHYDVSDEFYALWLDPRRVYSCAYYRDAALSLAQAQEAKLEHICTKLRLAPGERFLDIGAGWGALLLWAAEHHGVRATGITLSRNQHAHVSRLIEQRGLQGRVEIRLQDYRRLAEHESYDKIASIGMFEHVGRANLPTYFQQIRRLLRPGGLLLNHGITAGGTRNTQLGAGIGTFIERYIFPGGELLHVSHVLRELAESGLEGLDTENLRPHYARTLWAWSDALEAQLPEATRIAGERTVRAYRLYLAGSAAAFERGWMALHQTLAARPTGDPRDGPMRGAQSGYPFNRDYMAR